MAVVLQKFDMGVKRYYVSGGSLIHPRVVLTAAHRLYDRELKIFLNNLEVRVGSISISDEIGYEVFCSI